MYPKFFYLSRAIVKSFATEMPTRGANFKNACKTDCSCQSSGGGIRRPARLDLWCPAMHQSDFRRRPARG